MNDVDIENQATASVTVGTDGDNRDNKSNAPDGATNNTRKKWKVAFLATFLVVIVVVAITLGVTLGKNNGNETSASSTAVETNGEPKVETQDNPVTPPEGENDVAKTGTTLTSRPDNGNDSNNSNDSNISPEFTTQFLASNGPILSRVRMINPNVANGYDSCDALKDDIINALKHFANSIIVSESSNDWYEKCDPNNPRNPWEYGYSDTIDYAPEGGVEDAQVGSAPANGGTAAKVQEDSFETNNQVEGVDEADIVKSDGTWVFAGYGDILYAWNARNGSDGISITHLPYNDTTDENCTLNPPPFYEPMPADAKEEGNVGTLDDTETTDASSSLEEPTESSKSSSSFNPGERKYRHRRKLSRPFYYDPCYKPKPRILSLLLQGTRLTAIVSEENYYYVPFDEDYQPPIIGDYSNLSIRVYDVSTVPTDGSPLVLLGERKIKGNYDSARSFDSTGIVITTSFVDTYRFAEDLYRYQPQYCGLNASEYQVLASEVALNETQSFMEQMVEELRLDGNCNNIFQISAMQTGNDTDVSNGDLLGQFVQVLSFDMSANFANQIIPVNIAGAFTSGYLYSVYVSQDFAGTLNVGSNYNPTRNSWDVTTFVLGFDISGTVPKPFCYGEVSGSPINQYAVDLYDGHLRIATTEWDWSISQSRTINKIFVLRVPEENEGPEMVLTGVTDHLGKENESIFAVRFIGGKAYIVTFEQTDPFLIVDMSNHSDPKVVGQLEVRTTS